MRPVPWLCADPVPDNDELRVQDYRGLSGGLLSLQLTISSEKVRRPSRPEATPAPRRLRSTVAAPRIRSSSPPVSLPCRDRRRRPFHDGGNSRPGCSGSQRDAGWPYTADCGLHDGAVLRRQVARLRTEAAERAVLRDLPETGAVFCGANDYRGTDRSDLVLGDAWLGAMMSRNRDTWVSRLIPGFKGDTPSLNLAFGADPVVNAFPGGMGYVFIAGNRGDNAVGGIFFQRWVEMNKEDGYPFEPASEPIHQITQRGVRPVHRQARGHGEPDCWDLRHPVQASRWNIGHANCPEVRSRCRVRDFSRQRSEQQHRHLGHQVRRLRPDVGYARHEDHADRQRESYVSLASIGDKFVATWRRFKDSNAPDAVMAAVSATGGANGRLASYPLSSRSTSPAAM